MSSNPSARRPRQRAGREAGPGPSLADLHEDLLRAFGPLRVESDPLEVELFASAMQGTWWGAATPGLDPDELFGRGVVDHAVGAGTAEGLALLRAWAAVGVTADARQAADRAADALAAAGLVEPSWATSVGRVRPGECWRLPSGYAGQPPDGMSSLVLAFDYPSGGSPHALVALVDSERGRLADLLVTDRPETVLAAARGRTDPAATRVDPAEAGRQVAAGLAGTDPVGAVEEIVRCRALALARCRATGAAPIH